MTNLLYPVRKLSAIEQFNCLSDFIDLQAYKIAFPDTYRALFDRVKKNAHKDMFSLFSFLSKEVNLKPNDIGKFIEILKNRKEGKDENWNEAQKYMSSGILKKMIPVKENFQEFYKDENWNDKYWFYETLGCFDRYIDCIFNQERDIQIIDFVKFVEDNQTNNLIKII